MWSALALLTTLARPVPPFQLVAMAFAVAFLLALGKWLARGEPVVARFRLPPPLWGLGVGGLFGFHFLYFVALRSAPPVEANLVNYLWPLLIVLLSAALPGERLRWWHVAGAALGLAGAALVVSDGGRVAFKAEFAPGYAAALASAFVWAGYSVLSRRFAHVPTDAVGAFCLATALVALLCHLGLEATAWPERPVGWVAILALGLGPVGAAFFAWDHGVKHGDIRALGAAAYAAPLLSTLLLVVVVGEPLSWAVGAAAVLVVVGAALAGREMLSRRSRPAPGAGR
ncbi:MAG: EamA family transporter [Proteobacteria bacterium]|nr:EamA family transporter [Pseudomonadota bacterium]